MSQPEGWLNLTRYEQEEIVIVTPAGETIFVMPTEITKRKVQIGIRAPKTVLIYRKEVWLKKIAEGSLKQADGVSLSPQPSSSELPKPYTQ